MDSITDVYWTYLTWIAGKTLKGRTRCPQKPENGMLSHGELDHILTQARVLFDQQACKMEQTPKADKNLIVACATLSLFQALMGEGVERKYAIGLCSDVASKVYKMWGTWPRLIARICSLGPLKRLRICVNTALSFPCSGPSCVHDRHDTDHEIVINIHHCPAAEYFREKRAADLCEGSWCNLNYTLAELWGGNLERNATLAGGDARCHLHFKVRC